MAKIPVGSTLAYAYGFTFGNFLTILGLSWLPLAVTGVGFYFVIPSYYTALRNMILNQDPSGLPGALGLMFLVSILAFICIAMIYVAIARQALGLRSGMAFFYFSLDRALWALIGAYLLMSAIYLGFAIAVGIVVGILSLVATLAVGAVGAGIIVAIAAVAAGCAIVYAAFRAMFLLAPVAAAEERHVLKRSWELGAGNFWRIIVIFLGILVPFFIVEIIVMVALGADFAVAAPPPGASPDQVIQYLDQFGAHMVAMLPVILPVGFLLYVLGFGLFTAAAAFAYRALVPVAPKG